MLSIESAVIERASFFSVSVRKVVLQKVLITLASRSSLLLFVLVPDSVVWFVGAGSGRNSTQAVNPIMITAKAVVMVRLVITPDSWVNSAFIYLVYQFGQRDWGEIIVNLRFMYFASAMLVRILRSMNSGKKPMRIYSIGTSLALVIAVIALVFVNQPQCPDGYTQAQIDAGNCIIGANIGLGLLLMLSAGIEIVSIISAIVVLISQRKQH